MMFVANIVVFNHYKQSISWKAPGPTRIKMEVAKAIGKIAGPKHIRF